MHQHSSLSALGEEQGLKWMWPGFVFFGVLLSTTPREVRRLPWLPRFRFEGRLVLAALARAEYERAFPACFKQITSDAAAISRSGRRVIFCKERIFFFFGFLSGKTELEDTSNSQGSADNLDMPMPLQGKGMKSRRGAAAMKSGDLPVRWLTEQPSFLS